MLYYYYQVNQVHADEQLLYFLKQSYQGEILHTQLSETMGYFLAEADLFDTLDRILPLLIHDLSISATIMVSFFEGAAALHFLKKASQYSNEKCVYIDEVLLTCLMHQEDVKALAQQPFIALSKDEIRSALMYVRCCMSVNKASERLYIHRNTMNYRLAKIENLSGVDIRQFHAALYFYYAMS